MQQWGRGYLFRQQNKIAHAQSAQKLPLQPSATYHAKLRPEAMCFFLIALLNDDKWNLKMSTVMVCSEKMHDKAKCIQETYIELLAEDRFRSVCMLHFISSFCSSILSSLMAILLIIFSFHSLLSTSLLQW